MKIRNPFKKKDGRVFSEAFVNRSKELGQMVLEGAAVAIGITVGFKVGGIITGAKSKK